MFGKRVVQTIVKTVIDGRDRTLALEYCDRALSIATELGIPLAKECQELKEKLLN